MLSHWSSVPPVAISPATAGQDWRREESVWRDVGYGCGKCDGMCKISDRARPDRGQGQVTDRQVSSLLMTRERERGVWSGEIQTTGWRR